MCASRLCLRRESRRAGLRFDFRARRPYFRQPLPATFRLPASPNFTQALPVIVDLISAAPFSRDLFINSGADDRQRD